MFVWHGSTRKHVRLVVLIFLALGLAWQSQSTALAADPIFFVSNLDETSNTDIYMADPDDSTTVTRLTTHPGIDNHPELSPDGTKLVWSSARDSTAHAANTNGVDNAGADFEIFMASFSLADSSTVEKTAQQMTKDESGTPDRHPHFSRDSLRIIYDAKYMRICWEETKQVWITECSQPKLIDATTEVCRDYEWLRIMDATDADVDKLGDNMANIDVRDADPGRTVWPDDLGGTPYPDDKMTYVGHPSFSPDGKQILFSAAVDGQGDSGGEDWEVYMMDWDGGANKVSNLRRVTKGTTYDLRRNRNKIRMTGGAHFLDDGSVVFTSQRTPEGNSQMFKITSPTVNSISDKAVGDDIRETTNSANDYVPNELSNGWILLTSDRGFLDLICSIPVFTVAGLTDDTHTINIAATGTNNPSSDGTLINIDAFDIETPAKVTTIEETETAIVYGGSWEATTGVSVLGEQYYSSATGMTETATLTFKGTGLTWYAFSTVASGIADVSIDGGTTSTVDLYVEGPTDDLDLILKSTTSTTELNFTDNDDNDEMLMLGDEVSWFCGVSPNLTSCTSYEKIMQPETLSILKEEWIDWMNGDHHLPPGFQGRDLYGPYFHELNIYMQMNNPDYWFNALGTVGTTRHTRNTTDPIHNPAFPEEHFVVPAPFSGRIDNNPPTEPTGPVPASGASSQGQSLTLTWNASTEPDTSDEITYDIYLGTQNPPTAVYASNTSTVNLNVSQLDSGTDYFWQVVAKDSRRGMGMGPVWTFTTGLGGMGVPTGMNLEILMILSLIGLGAGLFIIGVGRVVRPTTG